MKNLATFLIIICISAFGTYKQERTVTGTVSDYSNQPIPGVSVVVKGSNIGTSTDKLGKYKIAVPTGKEIIVFSYVGFKTKSIVVGTRAVINVIMEHDVSELSEEKAPDRTYHRKTKEASPGIKAGAYDKAHKPYTQGAPIQHETYIVHDTEEYDAIHENIFLETIKNPLSTFSIDVDAASYSNVRRFINYGQKPPIDAVRIEEMVNYFKYDYHEPKDKHPVAIITEMSDCPWNKETKLVHIGLQGKTIPTENLPPANLVFLIDVSGSMNSPEKLPLLKSAFKLLVDKLRAKDQVAIVVYAGAAGLVLPPTSGSEKNTILQAIDRLEAGGSTAGGAGLKLAYKVALDNFLDGGNNRVVIASDGDFNVGVSSNAEMERLIEQKRESGVFLTVLGFGMGNYKDSKMEILADKGNGNYAYIDNIQEARKVLVNEFGGTLFTIAKDVKLQIEFNPAYVKAYRLVGYENRKLKNEDFNNDKKDAGDMGSGHTVTAMYEIVPAGKQGDANIHSIDPLKYQESAIKKNAAHNKEVMTLKLRYKNPDENTSKLLETIIRDENIKFEKTSENFRFAAAVASFGMLLRNSEFKGSSTFEDVIQQAQRASSYDPEGYRRDFVSMVKSFNLLAGK